MVSALVLDIGEVLLRISFSGLVRDLGFGETSEIGASLSVLNRWKLYDAYERGELCENDFLQAIKKDLGRELSREKFLEVWNGVIVGPVPGIEALVDKMAASVPLYALTNSNETHMRYVMDAFPWLSKFKKIFTSHELRARKPERKIYDAVASQVGFPVAELLFIDDRPENVEGARIAGYQAEVCRKSPEDLIEILKRYGVLR